MMAPESVKCEAVISPEEDTDSLRNRQKRTVYKGINKDFFYDYQRRVRRAEKSILQTIKEIDLHPDESPKRNCEEKALSESGWVCGGFARKKEMQ
jgi:hypothetical protein